MPGECLESNTLELAFVDDIKACQRECKIKENCVWYTYYPNNGGLYQV